MDNYYRNWPFELYGLKAGLKQVGIIYPKFSDLLEIKSFLDQEGFLYLESDFGYSSKNGLNVLDNSDIPKIVSLYVGFDLNILKRFKKLDYLNQKYNFRLPDGKDQIILTEIAYHLGFPRCCFENYIRLRNSNDFLKYEKQYLFDNGVRFFIYDRSIEKNVLLNDFFYPLLHPFFVCDYNCSAALSIVKQLLSYVKNVNIDDYYYYLEMLSSSVLYFNFERKLFFSELKTLTEYHFSYKHCFVQNSYVRENDDIVNYFLKGDSFYLKEKLVIFKGEKKIFEDANFDGRLIVFDPLKSKDF